jgi:hypothetical protein
MKRLVVLVLSILALLTPITALGQIGSATVIATGGFSLNSGDVLTLQAQIVGCSGNLPLYQGVPLSIQPNQTPQSPFTADNTKTVNFTLPGNDQIMCAGQNYSMYAITWKVNGSPVAPTKTYRFADNSLTNLNQQTPIGWVPPVITNKAGFDCPSGQSLSGFDSNYQPRCSAVVTTVMPNATSPGIILTNPTTGNNYQAQPGVFFSQSGDTLSSIESECASLGCTYVVTQSQGITLAANHTLSSNVHLQFMGTATWVVSGAFTLTIPNEVKATLAQHFAGAGSIKLNQALVPVEWFGAVNDGSTDNTSAIQKALNSLNQGQILLQAGQYNHSGTFTINRSSIGVKGAGMRVTSSSQYTNPVASILMNTSATNDSIDVVGASIAANVGFGKFEDFDIERSVVPSSTAAGLSLSFTYGVMIARVGIQDSIRCLYVHASGSQGNGFVENSVFQWGYNGVTETSGSLYGIYIDSSDGNASPSFRVRNSFAAANGLSATSYGVELTGSALNDQMFIGFETAGVTYGEDVHQTSLGGAGTSSDIHFNDTINDGCGISCFRITGLTATGSGYVEITGGYNNNSSFNPAIDIESSAGVRITGTQIGLYNGASAYSACVDINSSSNISVTGILCQGVKNTGILLNVSSSIAVTGNNLIGNADSNGLITLTGSGLNSITGNTLSGTGQSLVVDVNSNNNTGLYANTIQASLAGAVNAGSNPLSIGVDIFARHLGSLATAAPTVAVNSGAGTGATASISTGATDARGTVTLNAVSTGGSAGAWVTVTFNKAYSSAPVVVLTNGSSAVTAPNTYVTSTTTGFVINSSAVPASLTVVYNYVVIG